MAAQVGGTVSCKEKAFEIGYTIASHLTEPLCKTRQWYWQIYVTDKIYPQASKTEVVVRQIFFLIGAASCAVISIVTTPLGCSLRFILIKLQSQPYTHLEGNAEYKNIDQDLKIFSWNICGIPAGYSITDGGLPCWPSRIQGIIAKIREVDADVVCLYEVFDIQMARQIQQQLNDTYKDFYFNIGQKAIGPGSGLFVMSKVKISDASFTAFPPEALNGRAAFSRKGFFRFDINNTANQKIARIVTTHLQHSEVPANVIADEKNARTAEVNLIATSLNDSPVPSIITGDLNMDETEFNQLESVSNFMRGNLPDEKTWGGDQFCATLTNKQPSPPSTIDYTLVNDGAFIATEYKETNFNSAEFRMNALSDHLGLLSTISILPDVEDI